MNRFDAVKKGLGCYIAQMEGSCAKIPSCADCGHYDRESGNGLRACIDALELIQQFETIPSEWTSVKEKLPEPDSKCLIYTKVHFTPDHVDEPNYRYGMEISGFRTGIGFTSTNGLFAEFWMLLPDPPVQEVLHTVEHEDSKESEE